MWAAHIQICSFLQKLSYFQLQVGYSSKNAKFQGNSRISAWYISITIKLLQLIVVTFVRMVYYVKTDFTISKMGLNDFIIDLITWALAVETLSCFWTLQTKRYVMTSVLNYFMFQHYSKKKGGFLNELQEET